MTGVTGVTAFTCIHSLAGVMAFDLPPLLCDGCDGFWPASF
ncbi:hypothetical protein MIZ03_1836 [Rhodoferax lithotrophicus]|uniref:Uncharacterized protein n=1 Tax=Rhodoferax lithotrophicus TaxID=2798804 RepID=A0ABM7ML62_9BURK|nr:hypothetical protein MIZ03_1836 [Rhodoferax sp. MIZ03]